MMLLHADDVDPGRSRKFIGCWGLLFRTGRSGGFLIVRHVNGPLDEKPGVRAADQLEPWTVRMTEEIGLEEGDQHRTCCAY